MTLNFDQINIANYELAIFICMHTKNVNEFLTSTSKSLSIIVREFFTKIN